MPPWAALVRAPTPLLAPSHALLARSPRPARGPTIQAAAQEVDYHRADVIRTAGAFVLGATLTPLWLDDSVRFVYTSTGKNDRGAIYLVDPARASRRVYFDHGRMAAVLSVPADTFVDPARFPAFSPVDSGKAIELLLHRKAVRRDPASYNCVAKDSIAWALEATLKKGPA